MEHYPVSRAKLRKLIDRVLVAPSDLDAFLIDYFPGVYKSLSAGMDRVAKVNVLMERVEPEEIFARLEERGDLALSSDLVAQAPAAEAPASSEGAVSHVCVLYAAADQEAFARFRVHLATLERAGIVAVHSADDIGVGEHMEAALGRLLDRAELVVFLISPDFLASSAMERAMTRVMRRHRGAHTTVLPVLVRPAFLESTMLAGLAVLPRDGAPIAARRDPDSAWVEVARELRAAVQYRSRAMTAAPSARRTSDAPGAKAGDTPAPARPILQIGDIFRTTGQPESTFVEPQQLTQLTVYLNIMGQGLVVEGPSGVGKTTAVRKALQNTAVPRPARWVRSKEAGQLPWLDKALDAGFEGHLIVDDFHYLDTARQRRLADTVKSLADQERKDAKITVIGINPVGVSLTRGFPDLVGRFRSVAMKRQPDEKIAELVQLGERAANVVFSRRDEYVREARGSFHTAQLLCFTACVREGVVQTLMAQRTIASGISELRKDVIDDLRPKYHDRLAAFATLDEASPPRGACLSLLWLLSQERFDYVAIDDASNEFPELAPAFAWLKDSHLAAYFERHEELSKLLHYSPSASVLTAEDPQLEFYLRNLSWREFAAMTGHRNVRFESDGRLSFAAAAMASPPAPAAPPARAAERAAAPAAAPPARLAAPPVPETLRAALRARRVIPFVGAGVSMGVADAARPGERLFPSWAELLERAAERLDKDGAPGDAMAVRGALMKKQPNYLEAARNARDGLGPAWFDLLRRALDPGRSRAADESLALPRALWTLGSKLIVTTNYDRVLHWTCPNRDDLRYWDIEAPAELVQLLRDEIEYPTIWHLHGYIGNAVDIILTPDGYSRLYPADDAEGRHYRAALTSLRILLASRTFLFIGFSFDDATFGDQLRWLNDTFSGAAGPHYVLARQAESAAMRARLSGLPLEVVPYPDHGEPLVAFVRELAQLDAPGEA